MEIIRAKNYQDMCRKAANLIFAQLIQKNDSVLGLATGSTMIGIYKDIITRYSSGDLNFEKVATVNLDEYLGLPSTNPQSYRYYMEENFFNHINISPKNTYLPDGMCDDINKECKKYDMLIDSLGGIDLQLLGLGLDGHIGFNEPGNVFHKNSHCIQLNESTIKANSRFFDRIEDVPKRAITMGIGSIMAAETIVLCVNGENKAPILKQVLYGPIKPQIPGSILQLHNNLIVIADADAFKEISF